MSPVAATVTKKEPDCSHFRDPIELLDGLTMYASGSSDQPNGWWDDRDTVEGELLPDLGCYFYKWGWQPFSAKAAAQKVETIGMDNPFPPPEVATDKPLKVPIMFVDWPDFKAPHDIWSEVAAYLLTRIKNGDKVDVGCMGGHGRTGTGVATILILQGMTPGLAIKRIRDNYCRKAVESVEQIEWLMALSDKVNGYDPNTVTDEEVDALWEMTDETKKSPKNAWKYGKKVSTPVSQFTAAHPDRSCPWGSIDEVCTRLHEHTSTVVSAGPKAQTPTESGVDTADSMVDEFREADWRELFGWTDQAGNTLRSCQTTCVDPTGCKYDCYWICNDE